MAGKLGRFMRSKVASKKRYARRRPMARGQVSRGVRQPVQYFKRALYRQDAFLVSSSVDTVGALTFQLSDLPNYTEFTNLYDQYSVRGIKLSLIPRFSQVSNVSATLGNNESPQIFSAIDFDDSSPPNSANDLVQYQNCKITRGHKVHARYWKPSSLNAMYRSATSTGYNVRKGQWIDTSQADVPHYGFKFVMTKTQNITLVYDLHVEFYLAMKSVI